MIFRGVCNGARGYVRIFLNLVGLKDRGASQFTSTVSNAQCLSPGCVN